MPTQPIIIIGMHRSGTTMTTRLLEELGLFVGDQKRKNYEAIFFQELNRWIMAQTNTSWDFPLNYRFATDFFKEQAVRVCAHQFRGMGRAKYLGRMKALRYRDLQDIEFPWSWKDPLNTVTLPVWMQLFPNARILHIYRNPIDVAASLRKREQAKQDRWKLTPKLKIKERSLSRRWLYNQSYRVFDINQSVQLWQEYVELARQHEQTWAGQSHTVRYESFLEEPERHLEEMAAFCGLNPAPQAIKQAATRVDASRKFAFTGDPELEALYREIRNQPLLQQLNYHNILPA